MPGLDDLTEADLPTLVKLRDMHAQWLTEPTPADFTPAEAAAMRSHQRYTKNFCGGIIFALTGEFQPT